ncbi:MAG: lipoate--protein ligase family protein [Planctomycetales bacterium]|nr:lipoate--protein ligase family protein [Planctomycetales bacterium]
MDHATYDDVCHVFIDPEPNRGDWNMAIDELLLTAAVERGQCSVRLYRWAEPTISLGYFQRFDDVPTPLRLAELPVVRRLTGGGAILHHHELTYSCAVPAGHPLARNPKDLYLRVHERLIDVLAAFGIHVQFRGDEERDRNREFLCFARGDSFDVVMDGGHKVLGSAQRRRKGSVLQHGSLVLHRSEFAPQFPGIEELALPIIPAAELTKKLADVLSSQFAAKRIFREFTPAEIQSIHESLPK